MAQQDVVRHLQAAIEASVYIVPTAPGLTAVELYEIGKRIGFKEGEIGDALPQVITMYFGGRDRRLMLPDHLWHMAGFLVFKEDPDLRNAAAFDFVVSQLTDLVREVGAGKAQLDRTIMVERAAVAAIPRHDTQVAITLMVLSGQLIEENGVLRFKSGQGHGQPLPSTSRNQNGPRTAKTARTRVMSYVKDVIERRTDGRPQSAEPFDAFAEQLEKLGYGRFRLWWTQTVAELDRTAPASSPLSALVLAAALVEGALTFVVKHARGLGLGVLGSTDFDRDPKHWKIDDLVVSAAKGENTAILDLAARQRAEQLIHTRQRIHAGRMLSEFPGGPGDLRPEEARDAKGIAELVVRRVLDWLDRYPPPGTSPS